MARLVLVAKLPMPALMLQMLQHAIQLHALRCKMLPSAALRLAFAGRTLQMAKAAGTLMTARVTMPGAACGSSAGRTNAHA